MYLGIKVVDYNKTSREYNYGLSFVILEKMYKIDTPSVHL